jgi:hypothetical protein
MIQAVAGILALPLVALTGAALSSGEGALEMESAVLGRSPLVRVDAHPERIELGTRFAYAQLLVTGELEDGEHIDLTRRAHLVEESALVTIDERGLVTPKADGTGTLELDVEGKRVSVPIEVRGVAEPFHASFVRDVMPVLARAGCNAGTCHGSAKGKNGFKLSLRGYDPQWDYTALTDDLAGRRFDRVTPEKSLFLLKPSAKVPHEGGERVKEGSREYQILYSWIEHGVEYADVARPTSIRIFPENATIPLAGMEQQIAVIASFPDGTSRDVTREAFVESSDIEVVRAGDRALVTALRRGEGAILARYEGCYAASGVFVMGDRAGWTREERPANNWIDELVDKKLERIRATPSALCTDDEFLRRVTLDLTGIPPSPKEVRSFLLDRRDFRAKREETIDRLIGSAEFVEHWTNKWSDLLQVNSKFLGAEGAQRFRDWIREEIASNVPYDGFVAEILSASGSTYEHPAAAYYKILRKPDVVMENTTQLFLGVRFSCNKCHDHPFERWTRAQHWQLASFFAQVGRRNVPGAPLMPLVGDNRPEEQYSYEEEIYDMDAGEVADPDTGIVRPAIFPYEHAGAVPAEGTRRARLVAWVTAPENPYFAKSYVNRLWSYFLGIGLIEPVDDIRAGNPPSNPELLDRLTADFISSGFDVRQLMRTICRSRTYQLSIETNAWNVDDEKSFSHARARRLSAEALYDALCRATGSASHLPGTLPGTRAAELIDSSTKLPDGFLDLFGKPPRESACECERSSGMSLGQALSLVNGPTVADFVRDPLSRITDLATLERDSGRIVDELYLSFLCRFPHPDERAALAPTFEASDERNLAALAPADERAIATELATFTDSQHVALWHPGELVEARSARGATITRLPDGSLRIRGDGIDKDTLTIVLWTDLPAVRGLRLEALPDEELGGGGPGLAANGNFVLNELRVTAIALDDASAARSLAFSSASGDFAQEGFSVEAAVDGKLETGWAIMPAFGKRHVAVFETSEDFGSPAGTMLVVTLEEQFGTMHTLGHLRLSLTDSDRPVHYLGLPDSVELALAKPASARTDADRGAIWSHFVATHPDVGTRIRMGATQDLAWALANSPAFLFNR